MALVKIWGRGQLTIPAAIRKELPLKEESALTIVKVGNVLLMTCTLRREFSSCATPTTR